MITGNTKVLVHLAYPAAHLRTPQAFNAYCEKNGIDAVLVPWQVSKDHLERAVEGLRLSESIAGMIVTIPHKQAMAGLCDRLEGTAARLGVVNVIRRTADGELIGRMLDGDGFVDGLERRAIAIADLDALLIGAGGVATAIAEALLGAGVGSLTISNRSIVKAEELIGQLQRLYPDKDIRVGLPDATGKDLVINGTALGMHDGDALPLDPGTIRAGAVAADVVMAPRVTAFLKAAQARGAIIHKGEEMLTGQIARFADFILEQAGDAVPASRP